MPWRTEISSISPATPLRLSLEPLPPRCEPGRQTPARFSLGEADARPALVLDTAQTRVSR
jgi:hypothetical protein